MAAPLADQEVGISSEGQVNAGRPAEVQAPEAEEADTVEVEAVEAADVVEVAVVEGREANRSLILGGFL